eukprot:4683780-Pleurochrysis_carterae.AAC.1
MDAHECAKSSSQSMAWRRPDDDGSVLYSPGFSSGASPNALRTPASSPPNGRSTAKSNASS